jgi:acetylornithine deacetylase
MYGRRRGGAVSRAGDVIVSAVCDEEFASIGAQALVRGWTADAAIVTEPTGEEVCAWPWRTRASRGTRSRCAGCRARLAPRDGVDAIARMGRARRHRRAGLELARARIRCWATARCMRR